MKRFGIMRAFVVLAVFAVALIGVPQPGADAQGVGLPAGFAESAIATDIQNPVGMEVSPDGRLFVMAGNIRRIEVFDDTGFLGEFLRLTGAANLGSGLLGLEFAPDFATTGDVYISYITDPDEIAGPQRFRLSKFSSDGSVADPLSEVVLFEVDDVDPNQQQHQGGDISVGADGKIYWALGDRVEGATVSQPLDSLFGKVLRLNVDGTIPTDNPFYDTLSDDFRAIYSNGLRNPYRMERRESTGELFMSEVGPADWEELNKVEAAANYGWPVVSGPSTNPAFTDPAWEYLHFIGGDQVGCAITGGGFYEPTVSTFPGQYAGQFFVGDHCFGWVDVVDVDTGTSTRFMTGADRLVEIKINPANGAMYYLDREYAGDQTGRKGGVGKVQFVGGNIPLEITRQPSDVSAALGGDALFDVLVTGEGPFTYQWYRDGVAIPDETNSILTIANVQTSDDGAVLHVVVTDADDESLTSEDAVLSVTGNNAPVPTITAPDTNLLYVAGQEYTFAGSATDIEDGDLDAADLSWEIVFHHDDHTHPFIPELNGVATGTFTPPVNDETAATVWYRIYLTATDSDGTETTIQQDVFPQTVDITLATNPAGERIILDGTPTDTPITFAAVAGVERVLKAAFSHDIGGEQYFFTEWSSGETREHTISTPLVDTTYTATYELPAPDLAITEQPQDVSAEAGDDVTFSVVATGDAPLSYQWYLNDVAITDADAADLTIASVSAANSGDQYFVVVTDGDNNELQSDTVTLTVAGNTPPTAEITLPTSALRYEAGQTYDFAGMASDTEDGDLPDSAFAWDLSTLHDDHSHPFATFAGVSAGTFTIPTDGETPADIIYQLTLTVTDSDGNETTVVHDILPANVEITLDSVPSGLTLLLDGDVITTPHSFTGVPGIERDLEGPVSQLDGGGDTYNFLSWSNGDNRVHTIFTPDADGTIVATYQQPVPGQLEISQQPSNITIGVGGDATFSVNVTGGQAPYSYQWYDIDGVLSSETNQDLELLDVDAADDGASFWILVSDINGDFVQSEFATLTVNGNTAPVPVITDPDATLLWIAGQEYTFAGSATDAEDGPLDASALSWRIGQWHNDHEHEVLIDTTGVASGTFTPYDDALNGANHWYRITLTATDSGGSETSVERDIFPLTTELTIDTAPTGGQVIIDGETFTAPHTFTGVAGFERTIEVPDMANIGGVGYSFTEWSDGGDRSHTITTPTTATTYVATYEAVAELAITQQPVDVVVDESQNAQFSVVATGQEPLTYQWFRDDVALTDEDASTLDLESVGSADDGATFHVVVTDATATALQSDDATLTVNDPGVDTPPTITLSNPTNGSTVDAPLAITGTATDDIGVTKVQIVIKQDGTTNYWNGSAFVPGWRKLDVPVDNVGAVTTAWTYDFAPANTTDIKIVVNARDTTSQRSNKLIVFSTVEVDGGPPVDTAISLDSPVHQSTEANPVTFDGSVTTPNLDKVTLTIKKRGSREYWNGTAWQGPRIEVLATVVDSTWSYTVDQSPGDTHDLIVFARVVDQNGDKEVTPKVTIFVTPSAPMVGVQPI